MSAAIDSVVGNARNYYVNTESDFIRSREISFKQMMQGIIGMGRSSLTNEILDMSEYSLQSASASVFVQQKVKTKPEVFGTVIRPFSKNISPGFTEEMSVLAIDGSAIPTATNPNDTNSFL